MSGVREVEVPLLLDGCIGTDLTLPHPQPSPSNEGPLALASGENRAVTLATCWRCTGAVFQGPPIPSFPHLPGAPTSGPSRGGTCSFSMGRVTLYMSMVLMMMAGVVRKKKKKKRKVLIAIKRAHQWKRRTDRCFLGRMEEEDAFRSSGPSP